MRKRVKPTTWDSHTAHGTNLGLLPNTHRTLLPPSPLLKRGHLQWGKRQCRRLTDRVRETLRSHPRKKINARLNPNQYLRTLFYIKIAIFVWYIYTMRYN